MNGIVVPNRHPNSVNAHGSSIYRRFRVNFNRYKYDFELCTANDGWTQFDTSQDAAYYGVWVNLKTRMVVTYCEGDETITSAPTPDAMQAELRTLAEFHGDAPPTATAIGADGSITRYYSTRPGPGDVEGGTDP